MSKWKEWRKKEDGVTVVIIALSMTAILSMTALVLDLGLAYYHKAHLQAACDAAALAAAQDLDAAHKNDTLLIDNGKGCFSENYSPEMMADSHYKIDNYKYEINYDDGTVDTWGRMECPTSFAKVFGVNSVHIEAYAQAINAELPNPKHPWNKAWVSDGPIKVNAPGKTSSIHSNSYIHLGYTLEVSDSITANGYIEAGENDAFIHKKDENTVVGSGSDVESYEIDLAAVDMRKDLGLEGKSYPYYDSSSWPAWNLNDGNWENPDSGRPKLVSPAKYKGDKSFDGCDITADLYIDGNLGVTASQCYIAEGVTVYVKGNLTMGCNLQCDGNLIVLGNISSGGGTFTSKSNSLSYIYCEGETVELGTGSQQLNSLHICAPKCKNFNIDGGGLEMTGSIVAKASNEFGCSKVNINYDDKIRDRMSKTHQFRLSK